MQNTFPLIIVDDEPSIAYGLRDLYPWQDWGFRVDNVYLSASDALTALSSNPACVVLSDIRMPGMDGLAFAQEIHERYPDVIVVLLSAYPDFEYAREAMRCGVSHYLVKPLRYDKLVSVFSALYTQLMQKRESADSGHAYRQEIVDYISRYVDGNLAGANLMEAAANLGFTQGHVSRIFSSVTGKTFSEYLNARRMQHAARLLCGPYPSVRDVAAWVGYENVQHFTRAFTRYFGVTPHQYASGTRNGELNLTKED